MPSNLPVPTPGELPTVQKIFLINLHANDWRLIQELHCIGQQKMPGLRIDSVVSTILTEACRAYREQHTRPS